MFNWWVSNSCPYSILIIFSDRGMRNIKGERSAVRGIVVRNTLSNFYNTHTHHTGVLFASQTFEQIANYLKKLLYFIIRVLLFPDTNLLIQAVLRITIDKLKIPILSVVSELIYKSII
jgi:hypothetical protein